MEPVSTLKRQACEVDFSHCSICQSQKTDQLIGSDQVVETLRKCAKIIIQIETILVELSHLTIIIFAAIISATQHLLVKL